MSSAPLPPFNPDPALYPFPRRYATLASGLRYHYVDEGSGAPVVMVHGNPTWSFYYRRLIQALQGEHRALAPDHIGCGLSARPTLEEYPFTLERRVADLGEWIDQLALPREEPITLVLHDWGGMIGMAWAAQNPERVGRLVLLNTAAFPKPETKRLPRSLKLARDHRLGAALVLRGNLFSRVANRWATKRGLDAAVKAHYAGASDDPGGRLSTLRFVQDIPLDEGDPGYALVAATAEAVPRFRDTPTLIAWAAKDFVFDHHFLATWRRLLPEAKVLDYPRSGHYVLEDEAERLIPEIQAFLRETTPAPPGSSEGR